MPHKKRAGSLTKPARGSNLTAGPKPDPHLYTVFVDTSFNGMDLDTKIDDQKMPFAKCVRACDSLKECKALTWVGPNYTTRQGLDGTCHLKSDIPYKDLVPHVGLWSAVKGN
eukprot:NODE_4896_length_440_cov_235.058824_g4236_i0.p1 GENE.NODE_4896_length_440_cov_235.058824_g4236_i0~~NODE_4896_length_440_cov_235.058824_g4236_i0.p1  ORF type:complete len:129 (+),score=34.25 NODE_4896_length_440_cov_235.058824_g4236_i0:53-388(+)